MLFLIAVVVSSGLTIWVAERFARNPRVYIVASGINFVSSLVLLTAVWLHRRGKVFPFAEINLGSRRGLTFAEKVAAASFVVSLLGLLLVFVNSILKVSPVPNTGASGRR